MVDRIWNYRGVKILNFEFEHNNKFYNFGAWLIWARSCEFVCKQELCVFERCLGGWGLVEHVLILFNSQNAYSQWCALSLFKHSNRVVVILLTLHFELDIHQSLHSLLNFISDDKAEHPHAVCARRWSDTSVATYENRDVTFWELNISLSSSSNHSWTNQLHFVLDRQLWVLYTL